MFFIFRYVKRLFKIFELGRANDISGKNGFYDFLTFESAKISGETLFKYTQKRMGKLHYKMVAEVGEYESDLLLIQAKSHKKIISDLACLYLQNLDFEPNTLTEEIAQKISSLHQDYVNSAKKVLKYENDLDYQVLYYDLSKDIKELSKKTADALFSIYPMSDSLNKGNIVILRNHLRFAYANSLVRFRRLVIKEQLIDSFNSK